MNRALYDLLESSSQMDLLVDASPLGNQELGPDKARRRWSRMNSGHFDDPPGTSAECVRAGRVHE